MDWSVNGGLEQVRDTVVRWTGGLVFRTTARRLDPMPDPRRLHTPPPTHPPHTHHQYQPLLVGAAILLAAAFSCYVLFRCARRRARDEYAAEMAQIQAERAEIDAAAVVEAGQGGGASASGDRPKRGLKPALLARLPTFVYADPERPARGADAGGATPGDAEAPRPVDLARSESGRRCTICMDALAGARCTTLPCGHLFHSDCVTPWLSNEDASCPECRFDLAAVLDPQRERRKGGAG